MYISTPDILPLEVIQALDNALVYAAFIKEDLGSPNFSTTFATMDADIIIGAVAPFASDKALETVEKIHSND